MFSFRKSLMLMLGVGVVAGMMGCSSNEPKKPPQPLQPARPLEDFSQAPKWVDDPYGAFPGDKGKVLYAVGMCAYNPNPALTIKAARARARVEMANTLKTHVDSMMKDWMSSSNDFANPENQTSKQFLESVSRSVTSATLVGSREAKRWTSPQGTVYVLMALDLNDAFFKAFKEKAKQALMAQQDKLLKGQAESALADLDAYLEKQKKK